MVKIAKITVQQKNKSRFNIFIEKGSKAEYAFSVDEDILIQFHLRKGQELDEPTLKLLHRKDEQHKFYNLAIQFLSYRMRSRKEIIDYLVKKEIDPEQLPLVVERLVNEGLIDDREFATAFVRTRINTTTKGPLLLKQELKEKGVSAEIADEALSIFSFDKQLEYARKWIAKKLKVDSKKSFRHQQQQILQTLMQKGFPQSVIVEATKDIHDGKDNDDEWNAVVHQGEKLLWKYNKKASGKELKLKIKAALFRKGFDLDAIERFLDEYVTEQDAF
ncbi:recombination regulator RecX [Radiobacillus kanasensis]|uniref:recombination regulator RecX n=1 Tax=Radiobacillus kanasensis TaxID=2844358 RepID=UPI001E61BDBF|nr:recombination regulator RecX [Radiobacillus kanasensis]UFU00063.1 recombination regulator RecX [Radiobacillus kanasensis]